MMKNILFILLFACSAMQGKEVVEICAERHHDYSRTTKYKVTATIYSGSEMNRITKTYNYNNWDKFVVILWDVGATTIIEMDSLFYLSYHESYGRDQMGNKWGISRNTTLCR